MTDTVGIFLGTKQGLRYFLGGPAILFIARATWRDFVAEELRWVLFALQEAHLSTAAHIKSLLRPSNSADAISDLSYFLTDSDDSSLASLKV